MKTNIIANNTVINAIMKKYIKYLCAVLMIIGTSVHAWGTMYIEYGGNTYSPGSVIPIEVELDPGAGADETFTFELKNSTTGTYNGWSAYSGSGYTHGYMQYDCSTADDDWYYFISNSNSTYKNNSQYGTQYVYVGFYSTVAGTFNGTLTIKENQYYNGTTLQSGTFTIRVTVTASCTSRSITMADFSKNYGVADFTPTHTVSAGSGTKTWTSGNTSVATIVDGKVHIVGAGTTTIGLNVGSSGDYCEVSKNCTMTVNAIAPTLSHNTAGKALAASSVTSTGASLSGGLVSNTGGAAITKYGFIVGTSSSVTYATATKKAETSGSVTLNAAFGSKSVTGLTPGTTYYVRAFAYNGTQYGYSTAVSFTTLQRYAVTYYKNDGSETSAVEYKDHGVSYTVSSDKFSRDGYNLSKWHTLAAGTGGTDYAKNASYATNAALDLYAVWTPATYTVTLNKGDGSGGSSSVTATYNADMPEATMPTAPTGKTFAGYYYSGTKYYNADGSSAHVWDIAGAATLVASYTTATPTLTLASPGKVTISATSPSLVEGGSTTVSYGTTVTLSYSGVTSGYTWAGWNVYETGNSANIVTVTSNQFTMPEYNVTVDAKVMSDYVFSCASLSLTGPTGDVVYITSTAGKTVRSQEAFHVSGSGLTANTALDFSFGNDDLNAVFAFKLDDGSVPGTNSSGGIDADIYVYYTPSETTDGLDKATNLTVSMAGAKPKQATLNTKTIVGRHLPEDFVIAAKYNGKWYALPANMTGTTNPEPVEIAVDDADNPTIAYTAGTCFFNLYGQGNLEKIKFGMPNNENYANYPLFGSSTGTSTIGRGGSATSVTSELGNQYLWTLQQKNATITDSKYAKYVIYCANNTQSLELKNSPNQWGLYAKTSKDVDTLRLIPAVASSVKEAYFIEWSANGGVIEVDAGTATKVRATFNGNTSSKIPLSAMKTSGGKGSTYNYIVTFNNGVNFAAATAVGKSMLLEWFNNSDVLVGITSIQVPKIIASNTSMSAINNTIGYWRDLEVHVLPGYKLTANTASFGNAMSVCELHIYPGATVHVTAGTGKGTFTADTLVLRNGWSRAGDKMYDVARLYIDVTTDKEASFAVTSAYSDWYIDYDQYYPIAVPWDVTVANIKYRYCTVTASVGYGNNIKLRYYDGAGRANGSNAGSSNWLDYGKSGNEIVPATLKPSQGYVMSAKRPTGKAFSIIRMPLSIPSSAWTAAGEQGEVSSVHKNQVEVTAHGVGGSAPWYAQGWNFIANPYMACYNGDDASIIGKLLAQTDGGSSVKYATIPDTDFKGFNQIPMAEAELKPSSGFLVQVNISGGESTYDLTFSNGKIKDPSSAPARYTNEPEAVSEQEAYILLSNGVGEKDQMGLIIGWDYTANYEINADLSKMIGEANIVKTYMQYGGMDMAYVAINEVLAREWIPVTVHIPAAGEYTYSLKNSSTVNQLEGLYLIDYENGGRVTNLLFDDYTFTAEAGTLTNRFAVNAIVGDHRVPTGADVTGLDKNSTEPIKFIWHDQVYILHNNVIYDSTGKRVNVINK